MCTPQPLPSYLQVHAAPTPPRWHGNTSNSFTLPAPSGVSQMHPSNLRCSHSIISSSPVIGSQSVVIHRIVGWLCETFRNIFIFILTGSLESEISYHHWKISWWVNFRHPSQDFPSIFHKHLFTDILHGGKGAGTKICVHIILRGAAYSVCMQKKCVYFWDSKFILAHERFCKVQKQRCQFNFVQVIVF